MDSMTSKLNPDCAREFATIATTQKQILEAVERLTVAVFGNGKVGIREDIQQIRKDIEDVNNALMEQDIVIERMETARKEEIKAGEDLKKARSQELLKFFLAALLALLAVVFSTAQAFLMYKMWGIAP